MADNLIHDRGRGPELIGTRITVYNLLPYFLDPTATEDYICRVCQLTPAQVSAARAYVLNNAEAVLAEHHRIEARLAAGNPPEDIAARKASHAKFLAFRDWLTLREQAAAAERTAEVPAAPSFPTFQDWIATHQSHPAEGA